MSKESIDRLRHHKRMLKEFYSLNKYIITEQLKDALLDAVDCMEKMIMNEKEVKL